MLREDESKLDAAVRRADDLLITSLQKTERSLARRKLIIFSTAGVVVLVVGTCLLWWAMSADVAAQAGAPQKQESPNYTAEGWQLWRAGQFSDAAVKFEQAVKQNPKNSDAWNGLGWARFNSGQSTSAEAAFKKVIELEPEHPAALNGMGQIYFAQAKYDEAEGYLLKAAPAAPAAWYGLAKLYVLKGDFAQARPWAEKIVEAGDKSDSAAQLLQATKDKQLSDALRRLIQPMAASANSEEIQKAWTLINQGRRPEARQILQAVLNKDPKDAAAQNGMGWCLLLGGDATQAKGYFERAMAIDPDGAAGAMNGLARSLKVQGDVEGAIKVWLQMIEKFPGPNAAVGGLAETYFERGEFGKALPYYEQLAKANPNDPMIQERLIRVRESTPK